MDYKPIPCKILRELFMRYVIIFNSDTAQIFYSYIPTENKYSLAKNLFIKMTEVFTSIDFMEREYILIYCLNNLEFDNAFDELYNALKRHFSSSLPYEYKLLEKLTNHSIDLTPYIKNIFISTLYHSDADAMKLIKCHYDVDKILSDIQYDVKFNIKSEVKN